MASADRAGSLLDREPHPVLSVGVNVCTHDVGRLEQLSAAVSSLQGQSRPPEEIMVMVDGGEQLAERVRRRLPDVRVSCLGSNLGVSAARTASASAMSSDCVVFLDDDAVAEPDWLERLVRPLADPLVLGASGRSLPTWDAPRPAWLPDEFLWAWGCSYRGMPVATRPVRNFVGGGAVVRRLEFLDLGGFAAGIGHHGPRIGGGEEAAFCLAATAATGARFVFEPSAVTRHHVPATRLTWRYYLRRCFGEGLMKARLSHLQGSAALAEERAFARALPVALLRCLRRPATAPQGAGIVVGAGAVLAGLVVGRWRVGRAHATARRATRSQ